MHRKEGEVGQRKGHGEIVFAWLNRESGRGMGGGARDFRVDLTESEMRIRLK
jgi:hypothetical protein